MSHRINVVLDDQVWEEFRQIPKNVRSQAVNQSLAEWLARQKRQRLLREMQETAVSVETGSEDSVILLRRQRYRLYTDEGVNS